jgi:hypothetical protein
MCNTNNENSKMKMLKKKCDINIARTINLANEMIKLAQEGYEQREDPDCGVLYGILLDSGYRLRDLAQKERDKHIQKGWWNNSIRKEKNK